MMADLSILSQKYSGPIGVFGLGVSGSAVAAALKQSGVDYLVWDDDPAKRESDINCATSQNDLLKCPAVVVAAGIPPSHSFVVEARKQGVEILCDVDLLYLANPEATYIGITGTNGKSTTTALLHHVLQQCFDQPFAVGGNIGKSAASLENLGEDGLYALELSSYQIERMKHAMFDIAVCLNITPDHISWHGSFEQYTAAKARLFDRKRESGTQTAILGCQDPPTQEIYQNLETSDSHIVVALNKTNLTLTTDYLKGAHNAQNIGAVYAVADALGLNRGCVKSAINSFKGLAHRQEVIAQKGLVTFVNDSKATNITSTATALEAFDNIYLIAGGEPKQGESFADLQDYYSKISAVYLIGEASEKFNREIGNDLPVKKEKTLSQAVDQAASDALESGRESVVLLSPGCASFDQYKNFEKRGDHFRTLVEKLTSS